MMSDTPVAFSNAMILRHSFPMILPFRSSLSSCTIVCVLSPVTSPAYCWILLMRISRAISASRFLSSFFFFSIRLTISRSYISSVDCMRSAFASSVDSRAIDSSLVPSSEFLRSSVAMRSSMSVSFCLREVCLPSSSSYLRSIFCSFSARRFSCSTAHCLRSRISLRASSISFRRVTAIASAREMTSRDLLSASIRILFPDFRCFSCRNKNEPTPPQITPTRSERNTKIFI